MSVEKIVQYISEQVRKERVLGLHTNLAEAKDVEAHFDGDSTGSQKSINKIHAHIKTAGHTIHHDDEGTETKNPHVTAHYEMGDDRHTADPSGFTIHPKAQHDKKLMKLVHDHNKKYG